MNYYILGKESKLFGPYSVERLEEFAKAGKINPKTYLVDKTKRHVYAYTILRYFADYKKELLEEDDHLEITISDVSIINTNLDNKPERLEITIDDITPSKDDNSISAINNTSESLPPILNTTSYSFIADDGRVYGPYNINILQVLLLQNRISLNSVLIDPSGNRTVASEVLFQNNSNGYKMLNSSENDSGTGVNAKLPEEIKGLNFGAYLLTPLWGAAHNYPLSFLSLIPGYGWIKSYYLLVKGNEVAWQHRRFKSVEEFKKVQKRWSIFSFIILGVLIAVIVPILIFVTKEFLNLLKGMESDIQ